MYCILQIGRMKNSAVSIVRFFGRHRTQYFFLMVLSRLPITFFMTVAKKGTPSESISRRSHLLLNEEKIIEF
jgi:hypothetical protein